MNDQVIVNVDPFNLKTNVMDFGLNIAKKLNLPLLIYSVQHESFMTEPAIYSPYLPEHVPLILEKEEENLRAFCEEVKKIYSDTHYEVGIGFLASSVVNKTHRLFEETREMNPYLLVMAKTHDHNWWNEVVGTTETVVATQAPCPVLFVPQEVEYHGISRIMYLMDKENAEQPSLPDLSFLAELASNFNATVSIAYLLDEKERPDHLEVSEKMKLLRSKVPFGKIFSFRFLPEHTPEEILTLAELSHTDILAFHHKDTSFLDRLFKNDAARLLLLKSNAPVMVF